MKRTYTTREVANLLRIPEFRVRRYARAGLGGSRQRHVRSWRFDFRDLRVLKMACQIATRGLAHAKVERALLRARQQLGADRSLCSVRLEALGREVVIHDAAGTWVAETGQGELSFLVPQCVATAEVAAERPEPAVAAENGPLSSHLFGELSDRLSAHEWFELALGLEESDPRGAYEAYLRTLATDPEHVEAMINLGRLCSVAGELQRAAAYFRQAIRVDPSQPVAHFNLGVTLHDLSDVHGAIVAYRTALIHDRHFADAHYNLAALLEELGDSEGATKHRTAYEVACQRPD